MQHIHKAAIIAWAEGKLIGVRFHPEKPLMITPKPDWENASVTFEVIEDDDIPGFLQKELKWLASQEGLNAGVVVRQASAKRALLLFNYLEKTL